MWITSTFWETQQNLQFRQTKQALYNLDHPLEYVPKSIGVQRTCMKERGILCCVSGKTEKL